MKKNASLIYKIVLLALFLILFFGIWIFFYFEVSFSLRLLVIILGLIGLAQIAKKPEILVLVNLYLIIYDLYNIRYGLAVPLAIIMLIVLAVSLAMSYINFQINEDSKFKNKDLLFVHLAAIALINLEIFLAMSYWPIDPKTKAITIALVFFIITKTVYLHINNVLSLKRVSGFLIVGFLILAVIYSLNFFYGV